MLLFVVNTIIKQIILVVNILILGLFVICSLNPFLNIDALLGAGFLGILFPYTLLLVLACIVVDIIFFPRLAILCLIILAFNWRQVFVCISPSFAISPFETQPMQKDDHLRVMTWNVRRFMTTDEKNINKSKCTPEHLHLIEQYNPDVLCFQEFAFKKKYATTSKDIFAMMRQIGYAYFVFSEDFKVGTEYVSGNIIFSKYPILQHHITHFTDLNAGLESMMYADLTLPNHKTIRIFTTHLQSYGFKDDTYEKIDLIKHQKDNDFTAMKTIFYKMRKIFLIRKKQTQIVKDYLNQCVMPYVILGDFNDIPNSDTYFTISENLQDAFLEKGFGFGATYRKLLPFLRIDYILSSKHFQVKQFHTIPSRLSDHYPLVTDLALKSDPVFKAY